MLRNFNAIAWRNKLEKAFQRSWCAVLVFFFGGGVFFVGVGEEGSFWFVALVFLVRFLLGPFPKMDVGVLRCTRWFC